MKKFNLAIVGATALALAACGSSDDATNNLVDNSYDANATDLENATENMASEMDNLNAQAESLNAEAIDESDVTVEEAGDGAAGM